MKPFLIVLISLPTLWTVGCGNTSRVRSSRFDERVLREGNLLPSQRQVLTALEEHPEIQVGSWRVHRVPQTWKGVEVEGTWQHLVTDEEGNWIAASYSRVKENDLPQKIKDLNAQELAAQALLRRRDNLRLLPGAKIILMKEFWGYRPYILADYMASDESQVYEAKITKEGRLLSLRPKGFELTSGLAQVYPDNPNQVPLTEMVLKNLVGDGNLSSPYLVVESAIGEKPFNRNNIFNFQPNELVFSAVQAYFFASRAVDWFRQQLHLELKAPLEVKVHVGSTPQSNVAFYYNNQVRLGEGDGITYEGIPRDPTIVAHEVSHAFVQMLSGLPFEGEGGSYSEAFADFFAAIHLSNPNMGNYAYRKGPFKRTLDNNLRADKDFKKAMYNDSQIISGTFWDLTKVIEPAIVEKLAVDFLVRLGPGGQFHDFTEVMKSTIRAASLKDEQIQQIQTVLEKRGWIASGEEFL